MTPKNAPWSHRHQRPGCRFEAIALLAATTTGLLALGHLFTDPLPSATAILEALL